MARRNPTPEQERVYARYRETILEGMARGLWLFAYMQWAEELSAEEREELDVEVPRPGGSWDKVVPETPKAAMKAADELAKLYEGVQGHGAGGNIVDLFVFAEEADMEGEMFSLSEDEGPSERQALDRRWKMSDADEFGYYLAAMALGEGISWFDDHKAFELQKPRFECHFDGEDLVWSGGSAFAPEIAARIGSIYVANRNARDFSDHSYLFAFGGFTIATQRLVLVYADSLQSGLEGLIEWVAENEPNSVANEQLQEAYAEAVREVREEHPELDEEELFERAHDQAYVDVDDDGNGTYIHSEDWRIIAEDPSEAELRRIGSTRNPSSSFDIAGVTNPARHAPVRVEWKTGQVDTYATPKDARIAIVRKYDDAVDIGHADDPPGRESVDVFVGDRWVNDAAVIVYDPEHPWPEGIYANPRGREAGPGDRVMVGPDRDDRGGSFVVGYGDQVQVTSTGEVGKLIRRRVGSRSDRDVVILCDDGSTITVPAEDVTPIHTNPGGRFTAKGERMYQSIKRGYQRVGEERAKEIAARTVEKASKHGTPGLVKGAPKRKRRR